MKPNAKIDTTYGLSQYAILVHRQKDTARVIREKLLHSNDAALVQLQTQTHGLLTEVVRLVANAPMELRSLVGHVVFEDMHRDGATALTFSTSTPLEAAGADLQRKCLSMSIDLGVNILTRLSVDALPTSHLAGNRRVGMSYTLQVPLGAWVSSPAVERAKALHILKMGTTRL
ncbi:MAG: hypothetical protein NVSMB52_13890 [Chloroflexota bacterium]